MKQFAKVEQTPERVGLKLSGRSSAAKPGQAQVGRARRLDKRLQWDATPRFEPDQWQWQCSAVSGGLVVMDGGPKAAATAFCLVLGWLGWPVELCHGGTTWETLNC